MSDAKLIEAYSNLLARHATKCDEFQKLQKKLELAVESLEHLYKRDSECKCQGHQPFKCTSCIKRETLEKIKGDRAR